MSEENKIYEAVAKAIIETIKEIGLDRFKQTSFFVSNVVKKKANKS